MTPAQSLLVDIGPGKPPSLYLRVLAALARGGWWRAAALAEYTGGTRESVGACLANASRLGHAVEVEVCEWEITDAGKARAAR